MRFGSGDSVPEVCPDSVEFGFRGWMGDKDVRFLDNRFQGAGEISPKDVPITPRDYNPGVLLNIIPIPP